MQTLACDRRTRKESVSVLWHDEMTAFTSKYVNCYKYMWQICDNFAIKGLPSENMSVFHAAQ